MAELAGLNWGHSSDFAHQPIKVKHGLKLNILLPAPYLGENPEHAKVKIGAPHFVDFGKNMEHSPDGKAYLVAHGSTDSSSCNSWIQGDNIYLLRVTPGLETINNPESYEFYAGKDKKGNAVWTSDFSKIEPLLDWPGHLGCVTVTYNTRH